MELEILIELEFDLYHPTSLEFQMIYESLIEPWEKIKDKRVALKFDRI